MNKWFRALVLSAVATALLASVSFAGPGKNGESGDPDRPNMLTNPTLHETSVDTMASRDSVATPAISSEWKLLLRAYLRLLHIFVG